MRAGETAALSNNQVVVHVTGKGLKSMTKQKNGGFFVMAFITLIVIVFAVLFGSGNLIPSAISERLIEQTDVQYADAVQSKILVFQQALKTGDVPKNTAKRLSELGVEIKNGDNGFYLEYNNKTVAADDFYNAVNSDASLYNAFNQATYGRAAYYYDGAAQKVFKNLGISRNNYTAETDFDETMTKILGNGSNINVNSVTLVKRTTTEDGKTKTYYEYVETGQNATSNGEANNFVNAVRQKNLAKSSEVASLYSAEALNIADTISKEQRSAKFFVAFMENISKMKAGEGSDSKITEVMSYLNRETENSVVDIDTGEIVTVKGSPLESPSLYAVLSGEKIDTSKVRNYASDRVLKAVENKIGSKAGADIIDSAATSVGTRVNGTISRYSDGSNVAAGEELDVVTPIIDSSLINNSFETINGIAAGELLVEGAVNVGKELAKASGATAGSAEAVNSYARLTSQVLAMDAEVDRMNRSPFDVTSKNTFLGSIVYKLAISISGSQIFSGVRTFLKATSLAIGDLLPVSYADDGSDNYLGTFGDCTTLNKIGAVGSANCAEIATFDTTTLEGIFSDAGFIDFINQNTTLGTDGTRTIKKNSILDNFVKYNNGRVSPLGTMDSGILGSIIGGASNIQFIQSAATIISNLFSASDSDKRVATGEAFVNSGSNSDWQTYKYAQRYVSLARATEALRQYSGDETAYSNLLYFENPSSQRSLELLGDL